MGGRGESERLRHIVSQSNPILKTNGGPILFSVRRYCSVSIRSKRYSMGAVNCAWLGGATSEEAAIRRPSSPTAWYPALELDGTTAQLQ